MTNYPTNKIGDTIKQTYPDGCVVKGFFNGGEIITNKNYMISIHWLIKILDTRCVLIEKSYKGF